MRPFFLFFIFLFSLFVEAKEASQQTRFFDYQLSALGRTYPVGASIRGEMGYNSLLWGNPSEDWRYGYLRPFSRFDTIAILNRFTIGLDLFPVSPLGLTVSQSWTLRAFDSRQFNCAEVQCRGLTVRRAIGVRAAIGAKGLFFIHRFQYVFHRHSPTLKPFVEETHVLTGAPGGDELLSTSSVFGYHWNPWSAGLLLNSGKMMKSQNKHVSLYGFGKVQKGKWRLILGTGYFWATPISPGVSIIGAIRWVGKPSLSLI